jgi:hypothetical protein
MGKAMNGFGKSLPEEMRLEHWPIERIIPSPRNARTHSDAQVAEIAGSKHFQRQSIAKKNNSKVAGITTATRL